jgi:predicted RNA-binding Zn-ribbon protein involved in translation (DUF1610 family)
MGIWEDGETFHGGGDYSGGISSQGQATWTVTASGRGPGVIKDAKGRVIAVLGLGQTAWISNGAANWYPPIAQNAVLVPTEEVPVEKIRCPDCGVEDIALSKDAYKEHTYTTLDCGCRFSEPRLLRALKRHVL